MKLWLKLHYIERILYSSEDVYAEVNREVSVTKPPLGNTCIWNCITLMKSDEFVF